MSPESRPRAWRRVAFAATLAALTIIVTACSDQTSAGVHSVARPSAAPHSPAAGTPSPQATAATAAPVPTPAIQSLASGCGSPTAHVYHPARLRLLNPCVTVNGTIAVIRDEADGDRHLLLRLDAGQGQYLNPVNLSQQHGDLVLETVCVGTVTQADAVSACAGYRNPLTLPAIGAHVAVTGAWVLDTDHGWMEIHPVASFGQGVAAWPSPVAPVPVVAAPPASTPSLAQLRAEGISAICRDGSYSHSQHRSGTCSFHGGVAYWTGLI